MRFCRLCRCFEFIGTISGNKLPNSIHLWRKFIKWTSTWNGIVRRKNVYIKAATKVIFTLRNYTTTLKKMCSRITSGIFLFFPENYIIKKQLRNTTGNLGSVNDFRYTKLLFTSLADSVFIRITIIKKQDNQVFFVSDVS